jgi:hypothetical protein
MSDKFKISDKELLERLANSKDWDIPNILGEVTDNKLHNSQESLKNALGLLIEKKYGAGDVTTGASLNEYLGKMKTTDYPEIDNIRKVLYPDAKDITAAFNPRDHMGNALFYTNPSKDIPIRMGAFQSEGNLFDARRFKATLAHELAHGNDNAAQYLARLKQIDPKTWLEYTSKINDLGEGGAKFLEHSNNIENRYSTPYADLLTPEKVKILDPLVRKLPDTQHKEGLIKLMDEYSKHVENKPRVKTQDILDLSKNTGVPVDNIPNIPNEGIDYRPDRSYVQKTLEGTMNPMDAEIVRTAGHHQPRMDIPNDKGFFELRNVGRLSKGKGLLSKVSPILLKGAAAGAGGAISLASEASDSAEAGGGTEHQAYLREVDEIKRRGDAIKSNPEMAELYDNLDQSKVSAEDLLDRPSKDPRRAALEKLRGY